MPAGDPHSPERPPPPRTLYFTTRQNLLIAGAVTFCASVISVAVLWWLLTAASRFVGRYSNILLPPVVAVVLAMVLKPLYDHLVRCLRNSHTLAITALGLIVGLPLALFLRFFGALVVEQAIHFLKALPELHQELHAAAAAWLPELQKFLDARGMVPVLERFDPAVWVDTLLRQFGDTAYAVGGRLLRFAGGLLGWLALPIYTAFFLATRPLDGGDVRKLLVFATPKTRDNIAFLVDQFLSCVVVFFRGQVLVAFIQGILFGTGFHVLGLEYGLLLGICLGLLNIVPYLGNLVGLSVTLPIALLGQGGGTGRLIGVLAVFMAVQMLDGYVITPRVMGNRTGLHPVIIIFSLFFWNAVLGGVLGMVLAIPLSAFAVVLWRLLKREYFPPELSATAGTDAPTAATRGP